MLVRSIVGQKNEVHALLVSMGLPDELRCLQSKKAIDRMISEKTCLPTYFFRNHPTYKESSGHPVVAQRPRARSTISTTDVSNHRPDDGIGQGD